MVPHDLNVETLIAGIRSDDPAQRTAAWLNAAKVGAAALLPLAQQMETGSAEVCRAAKNALWKITRAAGAPGATTRSESVQGLIPLLQPQRSVAVRREVLWMLSEIADDTAVVPIAALMSDTDLRGDCRMVLQRIPGDASLTALKAAAATRRVKQKGGKW